MRLYILLIFTTTLITSPEFIIVDYEEVQHLVAGCTCYCLNIHLLFLVIISLIFPQKKIFIFRNLWFVVVSSSWLCQ